jgi:hypothetical protein
MSRNLTQIAARVNKNHKKSTKIAKSTGRIAFGEAENSVERDTIWPLGTWSENQKLKEVLVLLI